MEVINELLNDQVYKRVLDKFSENGPYSFGVDYDTCRYYFERNSTIPNDFRALGGYINAICFGWKLVSDIPQVYRINELYANTFTSNGTYEYIKNHINEFDREFFKDTITSNEHSLYYLDTNCFSIMPLEYIDDEMISLAILCAPQYDYIDWFKTVCQRKKEAISVDVWKLAARLYGDVFAKDIIDMTPPEYKDEEWYLELLKCNYTGLDNVEFYFDSSTMDSIPHEVITPQLLIKLFLADHRNISKFNDYALEMEIPAAEDEKGNPIYLKFWQLALRTDGELIDYIKLNDERINYFLELYGIQSDINENGERKYLLFAYRSQFKHAKNSDVARVDNINLISLETLLQTPTDNNDNNLKKRISLLPARNYADVPDNYEPTDYLKYIYSKLGITIVNSDDYLYYEVILPEGLYISYSNTEGKLIDSDNNTLIEFFHDDDINERNVYVKYINPSLMEQEEDRGIARTNRIKNTNN